MISTEVVWVVFVIGAGIGVLCGFLLGFIQGYACRQAEDQIRFIPNDPAAWRVGARA